MVRVNKSFCLKPHTAVRIEALAKNQKKSMASIVDNLINQYYEALYPEEDIRIAEVQP